MNRKENEAKVEKVEKSSGGFLAERLLFLLVMLFSVCCLKLCAEETVNESQKTIKAKEAREAFVAEAKKYIGCPYVYGAVGPDSFDCSGLIYHVARESVQVQMPRTAKAIYNYCKIVDDSEREVGDLLFFKTTSSGNISHVGIYIGNNQFISAISDGPNTGVIVSSLKQDYWKPRYVCTGQFLKSGKTKAEKKKTQEDEPDSPGGEANSSFVNSVVLDGNLFADWSFFNPNGLEMNFRGIDMDFFATYKKWVLNPGVGVFVRINTANELLQIPVVLSATLNDYVRIYGGPVISFTNAKLNGKTIKPSLFPGILGAAFSSPKIDAGPVDIQFVQDISYTIYNKTDGSALSFAETIGNGLAFYTGVRVSVPLSIFTK